MYIGRVYQGRDSKAHRHKKNEGGSISQADHEKLTEASGIGIVTSDAEGKITSWNYAAERMFGIQSSAAIGKSMEIIIPKRFRDAHRAGLRRVAGGGSSSLIGQTVEVMAIRADGTEFPIILSLACWDSGGEMHFGAFMTDITERRAAEAKLEHRATHDQLTRLLGQKAFEHELARSLEDSACVAVFMIDLDNFKSINDSLGHPVGDTLLQSFALRLKAIAAPSWIIGRLGGDEFAITVPTDAPLPDIQNTVDGLMRRISKTFSVDGHRLQIFASIGVAFGPTDSDNAEELIALADRAMFQAKRSGGRKVKLFDQAMRADIAARRQINDALILASKRDEWELFLQPQFDLSTRQLTGAEVLLRWRHPELGLIEPAVFMPVLETHLVAFEVGQWVLDESCRQLAAWRKTELKLPRISVNLFAAQFHAPSLKGNVMRTLAHHGLEPQDIELEITEKITLNFDRASIGPLYDLVACGVGVALDDFGTGFASLATLTRAPITQLKIDRRFVENIADDPHNRAVVAGMVAISDTLDVGLIAEGVETLEQAEQLQAMGCQIVQGFLFGKPMSAKDFEKFYFDRVACAAVA